jgi:hypothetical protein
MELARAGMATWPAPRQRALPRNRTAHLRIFGPALRLLSLGGKKSVGRQRSRCPVVAVQLLAARTCQRSGHNPPSDPRRPPTPVTGWETRVLPVIPEGFEPPPRGLRAHRSDQAELRNHCCAGLAGPPGPRPPWCPGAGGLVTAWPAGHGAVQGSPVPPAPRGWPGPATPAGPTFGPRSVRSIPRTVRAVASCPSGRLPPARRADVSKHAPGGS